MALVSTTAFVLKVDPLSERDLVTALLTKDHGVVRAAVKGARGRSRRAAALQTLNEVAATYFRREGADLARLDAAEVLRTSYELAGTPAAMLLPYLAESALTFVPESEPGTEVYRLVRHVLDALLSSVEPGLAARYFEVWLLRLSGVLPEEERCATCGEPIGPGEARMDPRSPGICHAGCAGGAGLFVGEDARRLLRAIRRSPLPALGAPEPGALSTVEAVAREARRRFLGHELRSYRLLGLLG